jgi:hypothetical protein
MDPLDIHGSIHGSMDVDVPLGSMDVDVTNIHGYPSSDFTVPFKTLIPVKAPPWSSFTVKFVSAVEPQIDGYSPLDADAVSSGTPGEETGY